ncbi:hypothetical protein HanIR_Chr13g0666431 [Helianthus annuus]|nr:hypothetical protein HanIR_Chr13g0666431 [Helianthus annuus]
MKPYFLNRSNFNIFTMRKLQLEGNPSAISSFTYKNYNQETQMGVAELPVNS